VTRARTRAIAGLATGAGRLGAVYDAEARPPAGVS